MRRALHAMMALMLTWLGACGHTSVPTSGGAPNIWHIGMVLGQTSALGAGVTAQLSPQTQLGLRLQAAQQLDAQWNARAGLPQQGLVWRLSASQSYVAQQIGRWYLRAGAWPQSRRVLRQGGATAWPYVPEVSACGPSGLMLAHRPGPQQRGPPSVALLWGTGTQTVAAGQWAWQGDGWQPALRCTRTRDCPGLSICASHHRCVARHGYSPERTIVDRFALQEGMRVTHLRFVAQQPLGHGAVGLQVDTQRQHLVALRQAHASLMRQGRCVGTTQWTGRTVLQAQWRAPGAESRATDLGPFVLPDAAQPKQAASATLPGVRRGFARATWARSSHQDAALRFDGQQAWRVHRVGVQARVRWPASPRTDGADGLGPQHYHARLVWAVRPTTHLHLWLAPQWTAHHAHAPRMVVEMGWRHHTRAKDPWLWQMQLTQRAPSTPAAAEARLRAQLHLARGLRLRTGATLHAGMGLRTADATVRELSARVQYQSRAHALQLGARAQWAQPRVADGARTARKTPAPLHVALCARYHTSRAAVAVDVALGPQAAWRAPHTHVVASLSVPL